MEKVRYKIGLIGLGFVGLPLARLFIESGHEVYGIDADMRKIRMLQRQQSYLSDVHSSDIRNLINSGRFHAGSAFDVLEQVDVIVICVPTPLAKDDQPDLKYLISACKNLLPHLRRGQLIVLESSSFPGTTEEVVQPLLETSGLVAGKDFALAYSPERIDPGSTWRLEDIPKVVSGLTPSCRQYVEDVYGTVFRKVVPVSSLRAAEMTKVLENCQRFVNISFMNSLLKLAQTLDISLWEAIDAAGTKPYGFTTYYPGPGVGGHCIPVDPLYLSWKAKQHNVELPFIDLSTSINNDMPAYVVERLAAHLPKTLSESRIFIIGATYKRDVDDIRESAAIQVIEQLVQAGANVSYFDPYVAELHIGNTHLTATPITAENIKQCDCAVILTDHSSISYEHIVSNAPLVFDTRNVTKDFKERQNIILL